MKYIEMFNTALRLRDANNFEGAYNYLMESIIDIKENIGTPDECTRATNKGFLHNNDKNGKAIKNKEPFLRIFPTAGEVASKLGRIDESIFYYSQYQEWSMFFRDENRPMRLFSFRPPTLYAVSDLLQNQITVSRPDKMNDPFDTFVIKWLQLKQKEYPEKAHIECLAKSYQGYRIRSFIPYIKNKRPSYKDYLMWSHYANSHKGFCVEYNFSQEFCNNHMCFGEITYDNVDFTKDALTVKEAFLTKSKYWRGENEIRLIDYDSSSLCDFKQIQLDDNSTVNAIYLGFQCPDDIASLLSKICRQKNIKIYKMSYGPKEYPYKIKAEPYQKC